MTRAMRIPWAAKIVLFDDEDTTVAPPPLDEDPPFPLPDEPPLLPEPDPALLLPPPLPLPLPLPLLLPLAVTKGLLSLLIVALVRSNWYWAVSSCWLIAAFLFVVASEPPDFQAPIHGELVLATESLPLLPHDSQLEHMTLAVMTLPLTPLPASSVSLAALLLVSRDGVVWNVPRRGERVTLPAPSWYMMNMLEPYIMEPVPRATHWYEVGAEMLK